jgi:hypothetical protein
VQGGRSGRGRRWWAAAAVALTAVAGCSGRPAGQPGADPQPAGATSPGATPRATRPGFTVAGRFPVFRAPGQDTHAQAPSSRCDPATFQRNRAVGKAAVAGFAFTGEDASAKLLAHFLQGTGTPVNFGADSAIARQARASSAFRAMNRSVQAEVLRQLRAGRTRVQLDRTLLQPIRFGVPGSAHDLYLGFRGTQGLEVRGSGHLARHRFTGRLTYVIRDVYGFPPSDQLLGTGPAMRYLQVNCGAPEHPGGAHWFPDSITVTVPFRRPRHPER